MIDETLLKSEEEKAVLAMRHFTAATAFCRTE